MSEVKTEVCFFKDDLGKNLYKKKTYYIMEVEQEVLAKNKDEADNLFLEGAGIDYDEIKTSLTKPCLPSRGIQDTILMTFDVQKGIVQIKKSAIWTGSDVT